LWENVPDLVYESNKDNLDYLMQSLLAIGYVCAFALFKTVEYGQPQDRLRVFGICLHVGQSGLNKERCLQLASDVVSQVTKMKVSERLDIKTFLLADNDKILANNLRALQDTKDQGHESQQVVDLEWRKKTLAKCHELNISYSMLRAPEAVKKSPWFSALTLREQQGIALRLIQLPSAKTCDSSQCVTRMQPHDEDVIHTFTPDCRMILMPPFVSQLRVMAGIEAMMLTGFDEQLLRSYMQKTRISSDKLNSLYCDMAGNAWSGSIALAFGISVLLHLTKKQKLLLKLGRAGAQTSPAVHDSIMAAVFSA